MGDFDTWGLEGMSDAGSFSMPSNYYDTNYFDLTPDWGQSFDAGLDYSSMIDPYLSGIDPAIGDYSNFGGVTDWASGYSAQPNTNQIPYQDFANSQEDEGIMSSLSGGFDKLKSLIGGKDNMSTLMTLAALASMGKAPTKPIDRSGAVPSSVLASSTYAPFTPSQQANMEAFASKKNLMPLAQQFDPRLYGYGAEQKFFDREK